MPVQELKAPRQYKRIIQLELNEISIEVIEALIAKGKLPNFAKIHKEWAYFKTTSEEKYEHLEPWIQWCTAHTGKSFEEHGIFRLSDVHKLKHTQIWEALSAEGVESGIIGSMNCIRRNTKGGIFFPDPWAQQNDTYPLELRPLWDLIASRVQTHATSKITTSDILAGAKSCLKFGLPISLYFQMAEQLVSQKVNPLNKWKLAGVFDVFLTEIFKSVLKTTNFGYYTLFLNSIAHYQHHYWRAFDGKNFDPNIKYFDINPNDDPMTFGYEMYDKILGEVLTAAAHDHNTLIVIASGLSQVPYTSKEAEGGMNYYRLNDHKAFTHLLGFSDCEIFPLMSRDWQLKYNNEAARLRALDVLGGLTVEGKPLFNCKEDTEGYIFLETAFTQGASDSANIVDKHGAIVAKFFDIFTNTAIKSGHHVGLGQLWLSDPTLSQGHGTKVPLTQLYPFTMESLTGKRVEAEVLA